MLGDEEGEPVYNSGKYFQVQDLLKTTENSSLLFGLLQILKEMFIKKLIFLILSQHTYS